MKMSKPKYSIRKELVESVVEEWFEYRIYAGKPKDGFAIASCKSAGEANKWVENH